jgi:mono/diheme cytochrome c family protein
MTTHPMHHRRARAWLAGLGLLAAIFTSATPATQAATPADLLAGYTAQAAAPAQSARGQAFFTRSHGRDWSCASCHGSLPTRAGQHASTGKPITALAPAFNPERFSDAAKVEKWFRRNCNDVLGRECSAGEKADVLAWLTSLKP